LRASTPLLNRYSTVYDSANRPVASINPLGKRASTVYDSNSRVGAQVDPLGNRYTFSYDQNRNLVTTKDPLSRVTTGVYDSLNRQVATIDANGNRTSQVYDVADRPIATIDARGYRTSQVLDAAGRRTRLVDANAHITTFQYDNANRTTAVINPVGNRTSYAHDAASNPTLRINPLGQRFTAVYDAADRLNGATDEREPRCLQWTDTGCFHVINRGHNRDIIFTDDEDRHFFLGLLARYQQRCPQRLYHYCLMSNHFHLLVHLQEPRRLSAWMAGLLRSYVHYYHRRHCFVGHLFQGRFKSPAIQMEAYLLSCGRYIERNPLEAGMVALPWEYRWSSARACPGRMRSAAVQESLLS
jgi:YD repeat-containing protein